MGGSGLHHANSMLGEVGKSKVELPSHTLAHLLLLNY